jgi:hypothetical protein
MKAERGSDFSLRARRAGEEKRATAVGIAVVGFGHRGHGGHGVGREEAREGAKRLNRRGRQGFAADGADG